MNVLWIQVNPRSNDALTSERKGTRARLIMASLFATIFLLSACGGGGGSQAPAMQPQVLDAVSLQPSQWRILYSPDMPASPVPTSDGAWSFDFPGPPGSVHYLETPYHATTQHQFLTITFKVASINPVYNGQVDPTSEGPATFHLLLERQGDNLSDVNGRWWSYPIGYVLGSEDNTAVTLTVPLTADSWINVDGNENPAEFQKTLQNLGSVGLTFGSSFFGHGVNLLGGKARFTLINYRIW